MYKYFFAVVGLAVSLLVTACNASGGASTNTTGGTTADTGAGTSTVSSSSAPAAKPNTLTAVKADSVALDSAAGYWANAPKLDVPTKSTKTDGPDGPTVSVQAAYDDTNVALRLEWPDTTNSTLNKAWTWDGSAFKRSDELGDRMGVLFPIGNDPKFASKGCAAGCHNTDKDPEKWWMGSESADVRYDLWQWTAASTNPVGQAQDEWMSVQTDPAVMESGTHGDELTSGGSTTNVNTAKDGPIYMGTDLSATSIITGQQVAIDTSKLTSGAAIPASVLAPWVGSRGDVQAKGVWEDGKWVVVLMRALNTGHDDDAVMTPPKPYSLGVAVFDHADLAGHTTSPEAITLNWQ